MVMRGAALAIGIGAAALLGLSMSRLVASEPAPPAPSVAKPAPKPRPAPAPEPVGLVVKHVLPLAGPIKYGEYHWDETGAPAGPITVTVDLTAETMSVFRGGWEIGAAAILYGANDKPTPLGVYPITQKDAKHVSNLYDAPMPYMLRLTNDGVSIHGSKVEWGYATHGCIGVPIKFAKLLFDQAKIGDRVIITDGKMLNVGGSIDPNVKS